MHILPTGGFVQMLSLFCDLLVCTTNWSDSCFKERKSHGQVVFANIHSFCLVNNSLRGVCHVKEILL